jgi:thioredoxin-related protein
MRSLIILVMAMVLSIAAVARELPEYSKHYSETRNPFDDAKAAIELARATHRNILIEIGGNWCTWCKKMDAFLAKNPDIYNQLHDNYVLLKVNVSRANRNSEFMNGLPPVQGYPHMFISTAQGKMLVSKDTAELQDDDGYSAEFWQKFLIKWQPKIIANTAKNKVKQSEE